MKKILLILLVFGSVNFDVDWFDYFKADYFISETGNDNNSGTAPWDAWATVSKVNAITFATGDRIAFNRGDEWDETLLVSKDSITFKAFGSGVNPIISELNWNDVDYPVVFYSNITFGTAIEYWPENYDGNIYYVSADGSDSNPGTKAEPFLTIDKVNTLTLSGGDAVLFNSEDEFTGTITVGQNEITYAPYGNSAYKPVISGFTTVTEWTNQGGNIWESTNAVSDLTTLNMVVINGANTPMGREPELGNYYTLQSNSGNASITSSDLSGTPDWTGAEVVIRKERWIWQRAVITSQSSGTISYTDVYSGSFSPRANWGFFIQNDIRTLDTQNEWYFNPTTKKISIYSVSEPTNVKVASTDFLLTATNKNYITVRNISFEGANNSAISNYNSDNFTVQNCNMNHSGFKGVVYSYADDITLDNNIIRNSNYSAIRSAGNNSNVVITNNTIDSSAMIIGVDDNINAPAAIYGLGGDGIIQYNNISNIGYHGILVGTVGTPEIRNNFVNYSMMNRSDGGGIYTGGNHTSCIIDGNIVLNTMGYTGATNNSTSLTAGIYLDTGDIGSRNVSVTNNTVTNASSYGIFVKGPINTIENNLSFNSKYQFFITDLPTAYRVYDLDVNKNTFVTSNVNQWVAGYEHATHLDSIPYFFNAMDSNYYLSTFLKNHYIHTTKPTETGLVSFNNIALWRTLTGKDANSDTLTNLYSPVNTPTLIYNETKVAKTVALSGTKLDKHGNTVSGNVTLQPYTSEIYFDNANWKAVGYTGRGSNGSTANGVIRSYSVTPTSNVTVEYLTSYTTNTGSGNFVIGIYSDSGSNTPSTLLATTASTPVQTEAGYQTVALTTPVALTAGTTYFLAYTYQNNVGTRQLQTGTTARRSTGTYAWDGTLPATFPTPSNSSNISLCLSALGL